MKLSLICSVLKMGLKNHAPELLVSAGIGCYGLFGYLSIKSYDKCKEKISKRKEELNLEKLPAGEFVKTCGKDLIWPTAAFTVGTICVVSSNNIQKATIKELVKKNATLAVACKGAEVALNEFEKQTKEAVGEETFNQIRNKVVEKRMEETPVPEEPTIDKKSYLDNERDLYYDGTYGGYFYATELEIYKAFEETRSDLEWAKNTALGKDYHQMVPLGNLYFRLHNEPLGIGDDFGYDVEQYKYNKFDYMISNDYKTAPNGKKALVIYYDKAEPID